MLYRHYVLLLSQELLKGGGSSPRTEGATEVLKDEVIWPKHAGDSVLSAEGLASLPRSQGQCLNKALVFSVSLPSGRDAFPLGNITREGFGYPGKASSLAPSLTALNYSSDSQIRNKLDLVHFTILLNKFVN